MPDLPESVRAILLLPSGHRAHDEDLVIWGECPDRIQFTGFGRGTYVLLATHDAGQVDDQARALYILGGCYRPGGGTRTRALPDEIYDQ